MTVNTKKVPGRRTLRFQSINDIRNEATRIAGSNVKTLGNWTVPQIFEHLTKSMRLMREKSVDYKPNFFLKLMMRMLKGVFINGKLQPGIRPPEPIAEAVRPADDKSVEEALVSFLSELDAFENDHDFGPHPLFGKMTPDDHLKFNCRHCELHFSFVVDAE